VSVTGLPRPKTPAGRAVQKAVRRLTPRTPVGKIVVALTAEIGGALGDGAFRAFASQTRVGVTAEPGDGGSREERLRRYAEEALRQQQEAGRRAEDAYRHARAKTHPGDGSERTQAHAGGGDTGGWSGKRSWTESQADRSGNGVRHYNGRVVADYYEVLEVSPNARQAVIDKAYRALMREDHPDHGGDVQRAQLLNEAYQVLGDAASRARYDRENGLR